MYKEVWRNLYNWLHNSIKKRQLISAQYLAKKKAEPAPFSQYEWTLFWFLYHHSTEFTGIEFKKRFIDRMEQNRVSENIARKFRGEFEIPPFTPDLDTLLTYNQVPMDWILHTVRQSFIRWNKTKSIYAFQAKYKLNINELNNIKDLNEQKVEFNLYAMQSSTFDPNYPIQCHELLIDNGYLVFRLIHQGKFRENVEQSGEIELKDCDF